MNLHRNRHRKLLKDLSRVNLDNLGISQAKTSPTLTIKNSWSYLFTKYMAHGFRTWTNKKDFFLSKFDKLKPQNLNRPIKQ